MTLYAAIVEYDDGERVEREGSPFATFDEANEACQEYVDWAYNVPFVLEWEPDFDGDGWMAGHKSSTQTFRIKRVENDIREGEPQ